MNLKELRELQGKVKAKRPKRENVCRVCGYEGISVRPSTRAFTVLVRDAVEVIPAGTPCCPRHPEGWGGKKLEVKR